MVIDAKEKTALATSVGADERQSVQNNNNIIPTSDAEFNHPDENSSENLEEIYRQMRRMADPHYLHTVSMTELYQTSYESRPPIIGGLLYGGAYILAGAPKIGKSFLVAQIAYHVSTGKKLWDFDVHQGTVLYLALEDDYQRIQSRMFMMYGVEDSEKLHFATVANKIGNGLDEQLEYFMREHPDTKLIIIDTMQKIREAGGEAYSYASDYEIIGKLKQFADKHSICVLTVHHTRKQPAGDTFEMISGTTGLLGCADGSLLMQKKKRTALEATIDVVGRDQQDQILYLSMSKKWESQPVLGEDGEPLKTKTGKAVLKQSYSVLQDDFFEHMRTAGYTDVERGERGSSEEHLTVTQFKVMKEQERLSELQETKTEIQSEIAELQEAHAKESEKLDKTKERIQKQKLDLKRIDEIEAKPTLIGNKVTVDKDDFDMVITAAKKHITQEKKESTLQKALDAAHKLIAELKNTVADLTRKLAAATKELSEYKSVRNKLNAANVEQENERLRSRLRTYEDVISRNNLWSYFSRHRGKTPTKDEAR